jgi:hypothetical protein
LYRWVLAPAAIDAGLYVQVGPDEADIELRSVIVGRAGRRHLAPVGEDRTLCGRKGTFEQPDDDAGPVCAICLLADEGRSRKVERRGSHSMPFATPAPRCSSPRTAT